jgi:PPOX class probable F420-dependent enzyme
MHTMDDQEWRAFVSAGTRTGKLATTKRDGSSHVVPVWFVLDGDDVMFTTGKDTVKGRTLTRDPRVCMCVDDQEPPFSYVMLNGIASLSEDLDEMLHWATRLGARYMGEDKAEAFGRRNAVAGELLVRVRVTKVVAEADISI